MMTSPLASVHPLNVLIRFPSCNMSVLSFWFHVQCICNFPVLLRLKIDEAISEVWVPVLHRRRVTVESGTFPREVTEGARRLSAQPRPTGTVNVKSELKPVKSK